jgi:hypothetical protein
VWRDTRRETDRKQMTGNMRHRIYSTINTINTHLPGKYEPFEPVVAENNDSQWTELLDKEMLQMHYG